LRKKNKLKIHSPDDIKDKFIGKVGEESRNVYEFNLQLDLIGEFIKRARLKNNYTQEVLGEKIGVKKAQISKLENGSSNVTIGTIKRIFDALNTNITINVEL
jgi:HTH-type transcriptional regulator/antitoxin HipB